ncbi:MAG: hypothetical protein KatS3mg027_0294 [Bacteroidia bacterium]|nr:MAG: hypothetical protein KatS3mg027_0294 [Bacteroidia bacterium]
MNRKHFFMLCIIGLLSCKDQEYSFQINNQTNFYLNEVLFDWCNNNKKISLKPYSTTEIRLKYRPKITNIFGTGSLCITILTYSDTNSTYHNNTGVSFERKNLSKRKDNKILITKSNFSNNKIFSITLE